MLHVAFPLKGVYIAPNTPGSKVPSHGTKDFGEEYALDLVEVSEDSRLRKPYKKSVLSYLLRGLDLSDFYGWGQTVYAPLAGEVIALENDIPERNPVNLFRDYATAVSLTKQYMAKGIPAKALTGNYVLLKNAPNIYTLLAHLKPQSVKVTRGQKVEALEALGELGHSGNSTMPHLHLQFMDSDDFGSAKGLAFVFDSYELKQGKSWITVHNQVPKKEDFFRKV